MRECVRGATCLLLGAMLLAFAGSLAGADVELDLTKGQDAFQNGNYHRALRHFRSARKAAPERADLAHWEGAALLRLERFQEAVDSFDEALDLNGELPGIHYDRGVALYNLERYDEAEASLKRALRREPGHARTRFFLALTLHEQGRSREAVALLERVRQDEPDLAQEVGLVLGRIYAELGRGDRAAEELRRATVAEDERIARLGRDYLRQVEVRLEGKRKRWSFSGYGAVEYDTNVVLNPEDPGVDFPITDSEDFRTELYGRVRFSPLITPHANLSLSYGFYQSLHQDLDEFDFQGHLPDVEFTWRKDRHTYQANLGYQYYFLDSDDYLKRWELTNSYSFREGWSGRTRFYHRYRDDTFLDVEQRDGQEHFFGISQTIFPWDNKRRYLQMGVGFGDRDAGDDFSYKTRAVDASFFTPLGELWYFHATALYTAYDYELPHSVFGVFRDDKEWEVSFRTTYELAEHWNLIAGYQFTEHESTIDFFDYRRQIITLGVTTVY